ncbi:GNAT family N-acetyltransferase [Sphingomonas fennica]|nr:GNAT family N-acetyltransferase [Sphingomonas fennica]
MTEAIAMEDTTRLKTRSGLELEIRPVRRDDGPLLREFFAGVATDDLRFRFLSGVNSVSDDQIAQMVDVDHKQTEDFLALADGSLVATGLVASDSGRNRAEVAIVVRADHKKRGIGWTLLDHIADYARSIGIKTLESVEDRHNQAAIDVERDSGFTVKPYGDDPTLVVVSKQLG